MKNRYLPFGYKIADGKIVADSEQVEAVRRIFADYTAGQTFQQIANALSSQGISYRPDTSRILGKPIACFWGASKALHRNIRIAYLCGTVSALPSR